MIKKRLPGVGTLEVCKLTSISVKNRQPPNLREMKMHFLFDTQNEDALPVRYTEYTWLLQSSLQEINLNG